MQHLAGPNPSRAGLSETRICCMRTIEGVAAQEVHRGQLQRRARQRAAVGLENARLQGFAEPKLPCEVLWL